MISIPIKAKTLSPFYYHHLAVSGGSSTIPEAISDQAICFGLASVLGMMNTSLLMPQKPNYREHMHMMPWKASMLTTDNPLLLAPLAMRSDLGAEGGYPHNVRKAAGSGQFKEFFSIQEIPNEQIFYGAIFGYDPFEYAGLEKIVVRIGARRAGMVLIERSQEHRDVRLNTSTAALFNRDLSCERYLLNNMQMTPEMSLEEATMEVKKWK